MLHSINWILVWLTHTNTHIFCCNCKTPANFGYCVKLLNQNSLCLNWNWYRTVRHILNAITNLYAYDERLLHSHRHMYCPAFNTTHAHSKPILIYKKKSELLCLVHTKTNNYSLIIFVLLCIFSSFYTVQWFKHAKEEEEEGKNALCCFLRWNLFVFFFLYILMWSGLITLGISCSLYHFINCTIQKKTTRRKKYGICKF